MVPRDSIPSWLLALGMTGLNLQFNWWHRKLYIIWSIQCNIVRLLDASAGCGVLLATSLQQTLCWGRWLLAAHLKPTILLMEEILHQLRLVVYPRLSHYWPGFIHPKWCRISSINCIMFHLRSVLNSAKNLWDRHWQSWRQIPKRFYLMHSHRSHGTCIHFAEETDLKMNWQKEVMYSWKKYSMRMYEVEAVRNIWQ